MYKYTASIQALDGFESIKCDEWLKLATNCDYYIQQKQIQV